jgi:hypothetical protein
VSSLMAAAALCSVPEVSSRFTDRLQDVGLRLLKSIGEQQLQVLLLATCSAASSAGNTILSRICEAVTQVRTQRGGPG